jgi:hypothetical protein
MAPWLIEYVESSSILYENCQRMRIETVYTKTRIQLKIIILDIRVSEISRLAYDSLFHHMGTFPVIFG